MSALTKGTVVAAAAALLVRSVLAVGLIRFGGE